MCTLKKVAFTQSIFTHMPSVLGYTNGHPTNSKAIVSRCLYYGV